MNEQPDAGARDLLVVCLTALLLAGLVLAICRAVPAPASGDPCRRCPGAARSTCGPLPACNQARTDTYHLGPAESESHPPVALHMTLSLSHVFTPQTDGQHHTQSISVRVADERGYPEEGASVIAYIHLPTGIRSAKLPPTDRDGLTRLSLQLDGLPPGQRVVVQMVASTGGISSQEQVTFYTWW